MLGSLLKIMFGLGGVFINAQKNAANPEVGAYVPWIKIPAGF
jgi:hypothetical protein